MSEKARFTLCIQQKGVNERFERAFNELLDQNTASTRDSKQVHKERLVLTSLNNNKHYIMDDS
ncbi:hypothetical protein CCS41_13250 [Candidatus Fukatsuia symbiotica]|uniref:Uncharacterized protein n=1 Tax=Candidatus Fukatsuia symbiotica TaxID=1878942 RepID=A0A2U8I835_9GAMM|nr:hypothetical protein CCS41_13250 [Candidatus Fukatsuia symbiotica]